MGLYLRIQVFWDWTLLAQVLFPRVLKASKSSVLVNTKSVTQHHIRNGTDSQYHYCKTANISQHHTQCLSCLYNKLGCKCKVKHPQIYAYTPAVHRMHPQKMPLKLLTPWSRVLLEKQTSKLCS